jgi:hypothetical protein
MPITFLGEDEAVAYGISRFPFVRDGEGNVGWVSSGLRLIPRIDGD